MMTIIKTEPNDSPCGKTELFFLSSVALPAAAVADAAVAADGSSAAADVADVAERVTGELVVVAAAAVTAAAAAAAAAAAVIATLDGNRRLDGATRTIIKNTP